MTFKKTAFLLSSLVLFIPILFLSFSITLCGCETLKKSKPILPIREYEKMIVGRIDADYVGTANCFKACHYHDELKMHLEASTMGAQLSKDSGMPIVDCESCHGPGSLAIEGITPEKVEEDRKQGKQTECNYKTLLDIDNLPSEAKSLICLKCHAGHALFNLHNWNASEHAMSDVSCSDCHLVHTGADLTTRPREVNEMCLKCHQEIRAYFSLPSRHPIGSRMFCNDCHEPHGLITEKMLRKVTIKETCIQCHREKAGPFVYEHADYTEDCTTCHRPHGSVNNSLLQTREPFLCLQCHMAHQIDTAEKKSAYYTRCTDCHSTIHGTDTPSATGGGGFTQ